MRCVEIAKLDKIKTRKSITSFTDSEEYPTDAQIRTITKLDMALGIKESYSSM